ncbi:uncharacterized protein LOC143283366 [Babylonia areolata]|uniref:uncharacterized protein LOC143283366 n=1 Tax=Babylonia areolata TaxID=304850 RepID=UPI003FD4650A
MKIAVIVELLTVALVCWNQSEAITCNPPCGPSECCVDPGNKNPSTCQPRGGMDDTCLIGQINCGTGTQDDCVSHCPCEANLNCIDGMGLTVIPPLTPGTCSDK